MIFRFISKKNVNGNRKAIAIDQENKKMTVCVNPLYIDDYIEVTNKKLYYIEHQILKEGYEITLIL